MQKRLDPSTSVRVRAAGRPGRIWGTVLAFLHLAYREASGSGLNGLLPN